MIRGNESAVSSGAEIETGVSRRRVLRSGAAVAAGAALVLPAVAGRAAATDCCRACWVDVKPDSCPNAINPGSNGVVSVAAGWPRFAPGSVKLYPVKGEYDAAFGRCQDYRDPTYDRNCREIRGLLETSDGRYAEPIRFTVEDVNGSGTNDTVFKFRVRDLELEPDDAFLILVGASARDGCTVVGIDSVRVLDVGGARRSR
ncbi:hypothetical protein [Halegenticoccus soli]|uniref:hypothetical protein n=1 Tax=Halegenticoccus soli TaxID=1985678 RepID=UPI000C6EA596|nr:hypothetical protein [Halegenticoccus soli]